jgi:outer membrane protein assembly factor BamB
MSVLVLVSVLALVQEATPAAAPGHWPQWRGPNRDNVSTETGLLQEWPEGGPKLRWKAQSLGDGVGDVAIAGGLIFLTGYKADADYLTALDGEGKIVWSVRIGPLVGEQGVMRWLSQRTPVVDEDRVYAFTAGGRLLCLESASGKTVWMKEYQKDFKGSRSHWGFCDFPLVNGNRLICTPGGPTNTVVALDKRTGELLWSCPLAESRMGSHSAVAVTELAGVRQYVHHLDAGTVGISPNDGKLLWTYRLDHRMGDVHVDFPWQGNRLFTLTGWGIGAALLELDPDGERLRVTEKYKGKYPFASWLSNTIRLGDYVYSFNGPAICIELETGKTVVDNRILGIGAPTITYADGLIYMRGQRGEHALVKATPEGIKLVSRFDLPKGKEPPWTFPVVAGGRLYLRDQSDLSCYDVRAPGFVERPEGKRIVPAPAKDKDPGPPPEPASRAAFVATPQDVVDKMVEAAKITKDDVVYDLGSGDGRILITASRNHGCRSVGFEINAGLVGESRSKAKQQKLDGLVTIEEKDLFAADLEPASVIMLYLGAPNNARLLPKLRKLKPGSRIVSHAHLLGEDGPKPDRELKLVSSEDQVEHTIYVWTAPLKGEGK